MKKTPTNTNKNNRDEYSFIQKIATQTNTDLRDYTINTKRDLYALQKDALKDILNLKPEIFSIYKELKKTDHILGIVKINVGNIEGMLSGFHNELKETSTEIKSIQRRTQTVKTISVNKRNAEKGK